jgi:hypothetical protein
MKLAVLVVFHVLSVNLTPTSRMNTVSEYCDCNNEVANKFENLNKVGSRGKCMEDLRDVFWSMFEMFEVIGVLAVQRLAIKSAHRSTLRGVAQQCKQLETDPRPCGHMSRLATRGAGGGHIDPVSSSLEDC